MVINDEPHRLEHSLEVQLPFPQIALDNSRVVGYAAIVMKRMESPLPAIERQKLLKIARQTLECKLAGRKLPIFTPFPR